MSSSLSRRGEEGGSERVTLTKKQMICFEINEFADLPMERDYHVWTPRVSCHGFDWRIKLYPGGDVQSNQNETFVSVYLELVNDNDGDDDDDDDDDNEENSKPRPDPMAVFSIRCDGHKKSTQYSYGEGSDAAWGWSDFVSRAELLSPDSGYFDDGAVNLQVDLQVFEVEETNKKPLWVPKDGLKEDMLRLLEGPSEDGDPGTDIVFSVGDVRFAAHRFVLAARAPMFRELVQETACDGVGGSGGAVQINTVKPSIFRTLLRFAYSGELKDEVTDANARALMEVADRFGCKSMKLVVESEIDGRSLVKAENAADWVLFAEAHSCALLKETAIRVFATNPREVMLSPGWAALPVEGPPSIVSELMADAFRGIQHGNQTDVDNLDVLSLRNKLEKRGLDVGTREMLVGRLKVSIEK